MIVRKLIVYLLLLVILYHPYVKGEVFAAENNVHVFMDGQEIHFNVQPTMKDQTVFVPVRMFENLDVTITWHPEHDIVSISKEEDDMELIIPIGKNVVIVNDEIITLSSPIEMIDGNTMVPVRIVGESLGVLIGWDEHTNTVIISTTAIKFAYDDEFKILGVSGENQSIIIHYEGGNLIDEIRLTHVTTMDEQALHYTQALIEDPSFYMDIEEHDIRDEKNNVLGYIFLDDGTFINALLISEGLAKFDAFSNNSTWNALFEFLQTDAQQNKRGIWSDADNNEQQE
ncbi:stalk domain-containing protein [Longirhabdus pacifica]|uniref:stalk domain-containing protein n=1 Tax=Longirhabdus pacifica TaxID=2305227 RepID=UPI0013E8A68A|nr:stalk domain-containing protein [Longirhabdus pacifica]